MFSFSLFIKWFWFFILRHTWFESPPPNDASLLFISCKYLRLSIWFEVQILNHFIPGIRSIRSTAVVLWQDANNTIPMLHATQQQTEKKHREYQKMGKKTAKHIEIWNQNWNWNYDLLFKLFAFPGALFLLTFLFLLKC